MNAAASFFLIFLLLFASIAGAGYLYSQYSETRAKLETAMQQVAQLEQRIFDLETRLRQSTENFQAATDKLAQAAGERDAARAKVEELGREIQAYQANATAQAAKIAELEDERDAWRAQAEQAQADLQAAVQRQDQYAGALLQLTSEQQVAQSELAALRQTCLQAGQAPRTAGLLAADLEELIPGLALILVNLIVLGGFTINRLAAAYPAGGRR